VSAEDEPFVSKKSHTDGYQASKNCSIHITVRTQSSQGPVQEREDSKTKERIESTGENVARKLQHRLVGMNSHVERRELKIDSLFLGNKGAV